mmetsp:Transcript_99211/g.319940  ORF Transcript_99211/g.319940 Transcript_99211/m.319940 type:complete len:353 (-) Transcript_99211:1705-2763(-)
MRLNFPWPPTEHLCNLSHPPAERPAGLEPAQRPSSSTRPGPPMRGGHPLRAAAMPCLASHCPIQNGWRLTRLRTLRWARTAMESNRQASNGRARCRCPCMLLDGPRLHLCLLAGVYKGPPDGLDHQAAAERAIIGQDAVQLVLHLCQRHGGRAAGEGACGCRLVLQAQGLQGKEPLSPLGAQDRHDERPEAGLVEAMPACEGVEALAHSWCTADLACLVLGYHNATLLRVLEVFLESLQRPPVVVHLLAEREYLALIGVKALANLCLEGVDGHGVGEEGQHVAHGELLGLADEARDLLHVAACRLVLHDAQPELLPHPLLSWPAGVVLRQGHVAALQRGVHSLLVQTHDAIE